jgi:hypothetical protein
MKISERGYSWVMMTGSNVWRIAAPTSIRRLRHQHGMDRASTKSRSVCHPLIPPCSPLRTGSSPRSHPDLHDDTRPIMRHPCALLWFPRAKHGDADGRESLGDGRRAVGGRVGSKGKRCGAELVRSSGVVSEA